MGLEAKTIVRHGRKRFAGKLHLDSKSLTFRGPEFRWSAELGNSVTAETKDDLLIVSNGTEKVSFEVGPQAQAWVKKILDPPNLITKLGIKPKQKLWISKGFPKSFIAETKQHGASVTRQIEDCELAFWCVTKREQLIEFVDIADRLPERVNLWIVWTKGSQSIGQTDVMNQAKSSGFGPSKTAAFDDKHSSMRFARKKR
jgi:hypothetical protein